MIRRSRLLRARVASAHGGWTAVGFGRAGRGAPGRFAGAVTRARRPPL